VAAAEGQADQQQQQQQQHFGAGAAGLRMSANSRHGSKAGSAVGSPAAATQPLQQQQQQQRAGSSLSNASAGGAANAAGAAAGQLTGLSHAMSSQSSYSFAPSPGSSILGGGSPGKSNASEQLPSLPFSPSLGQRSGSGHPGMGVEAVHAAAAAAAVAAQMGGLRVGSPAPGSSGSGTGLAALQQQRQQWGGSGGGLKPGEQVGGLLGVLVTVTYGTQRWVVVCKHFIPQPPVSPRAVPFPMSPSCQGYLHQLIHCCSV
jgi:hypothetical protein